MTNTNTNTNEPIAFVQAKEAGRAWEKAGKENAKGDALATVSLVAEWTSFEFNYEVPINKDETETRVGRPCEMEIELKNAEGGKDNKATSARFNALCDKFFGVADPSNAIAQSVRRALLKSRYLVAQDVTPELNGKKELKVPYGVVVKEPAPDASELAKATYEAMKNKSVALDGKEGLSLTELRNRASAAFPVKGRKSKDKKAPTEEESFATAVKFLTKTLERLNNPANDEAELALSNDRRRELFELATHVANYFAVDPLDLDEEIAA